MPGDEQQREDVEQLLLVELVAVLLGGDEAGQQVVGGPPTAGGDELAEVVVELEFGLFTADQLVGCLEEVGVDAPGHLLGPPAEPALVLDGHADELADDHHGQGIGEAADQVELAAVAQRRQLGHPLLDAGP